MADDTAPATPSPAPPVSSTPAPQLPNDDARDEADYNVALVARNEADTFTVYVPPAEGSPDGSEAMPLVIGTTPTVLNADTARYVLLHANASGVAISAVEIEEEK